MFFNLKLIGYPIKHSMSPWIHQQFLHKSGLEGQYSLFEIRPDDDFEEKIKLLKADHIDGFNITVPYKKKIIPYLDGIDETAKVMGAVNTVLAKDGKWFGYNTDGMGYVRAVKNEFPSLFNQEQTNVLIIGSGGASRAIYFALVEAGIQAIDIGNRTKAKAEDIAALGNGKVQTNIYALEEVEAVLDKYDLIIQTTSVGMKPNQNQSPLTIKQLKKDAVVSDIIYQPIKTELLKQAEAVHGNIHYGHTMLLYQAQYAFEIWTNKRIDVIGMEIELQEILEGR